jgi:LAS superfamily LD-carboxypeptidase LdcB
LILDKVWPFLQKLLGDAANAGVDILIISAHRSFGQQAGLKSSYLMLSYPENNTY